ncbi:hypothetical protein EXIGLDRAFT_835491 [Exidia glandulosa HHB12029]|uniref:Protein YOP1 n=1 Tax=Exidia glandulosa HHB12029 TaxID=1314781 RepID=A0A165IRV9_EXIGL|nr:hypothetical protein EXIGLDRAFT_835491 [Exidia glandulosa HHB12029]
MLYYTLRFLTLSHRPVSDAELERWVKHWAVLGVFVAFEYLFEWFIYWLPFYYEIKTIFLLFCSLPQTQGAIYVYDMYLSPFLTRNETVIDAHIDSARSNILTFLQARLSGVFQAVYQALTNAQAQAAQNAQANNKPAPQPVVAVPAQLASNLYGFLGSVLAGSIAKANAPAAQQQAQPQQVPLPPTPAAQ